MSKNADITPTPFLKMHGIGNDFVVLDGRASGFALDGKVLRAISDRRKGIGCDQILVLEPADGADVFMRIFNADGTEAEQCGNGTRCVASLVMEELGKDEILLETRGGIINCHRVPGGVAIDISEPSFEWQKVPLAEERDTLHLGLRMGALSDPVALSIGNPHVVFFVPDAEAINVAALGPKIETYFLFPERVNVSIAEVRATNEIRLRVWERGTGITLACGSAACATLVAAAARGLTGRKASILMDGGNLAVEWRADNRIILSGPAEISFKGTLDLPLYIKREHVA